MYKDRLIIGLENNHDGYVNKINIKISNDKKNNILMLHRRKNKMASVKAKWFENQHGDHQS